MQKIYSLFWYAAPALYFSSLQFAYGAVTNISTLETFAFDMVGVLTTFLITLAIVVFFWGLVKFIRNAEDTAAHEEGKKFIMWGIISFVVLYSIWSLVGFILYGSLDLTNLQPGYIDSDGNAH